MNGVQETTHTTRVHIETRDVAFSSNATVDLQKSPSPRSFLTINRGKPPSAFLDLDNTLESHVALFQASPERELVYAYSVEENTPATSQVWDQKLAGIMAQFEELVTHADDGGWVRPTEYAHRKALRLLTAAYTLTELQDSQCYRKIPEPVLTTDSQGGIRVAWRTAGKEIRANVGAEPHLRTYLYFERGNEYGTQDLSDRTISDQLRRLLAS